MKGRSADYEWVAGSSDSADSDIDDSEEEDLDDGAKEEAALRKSEKRARVSPGVLTGWRRRLVCRQVAQNQQKMTYKDPGLKKKSTATTAGADPCLVQLKVTSD